MMKKIALAAFLALSTLGANAMFMVPPNVPVDRLITNTEAYIKENPKDASGYYALARIHYLAFALKTTQLKVFENQQQGKPLEVSPMFNGKPGTKPENIPADVLEKHLKAGIENYRKSIEMDEKNGLYHLGFASLLDSAADSELKLGQIPGEKESDAKDLKPVWKEKAISEYKTAHELALDKDLAVRFQPITGINSLVSYEAGTQYLKLTHARGQKDDEKAFVKTVTDNLEKLANKPMGPITPLLFNTDRNLPLNQLLDSSKTVHFDLDGTGREQTYPWIKPDTALLAWDFNNTGKITNGWQLFGSVSFNIFWNDGYRALDALDDNRDGQLSGNELKGLVLWRDKNSNGVSDEGELTPIEKSGVESILTHSAGQEGLSPIHPGGMRMQNGAILPTYDWTTVNLANP